MIHFRTLDVDGLWKKIETREFEQKDKIQRFQAEKIIKRFDTKHVEVIIGPRQSGKTTLLLMLIAELLLRKVKKENIFYLNIDTTVHLEQFENPLLFVKTVENLAKQGDRIYLFLDEVQRLKNPGRFIKGIHDLEQKIKIFVSGSSSLEVKSRIKEFLTGRKRETLLLPLSFKEYVNKESKVPQGGEVNKLEKKSLADWIEMDKIYGKHLVSKMEDMAIYGGYPGVLIREDKDERIEELAEIYNSYVKKDIIDFFKIERPEVFNNLVKALSTQAGNLLNKSEICSLTGSSIATTSKYMEILKDTYITYFLAPFLSNRRNEIKSAHKCYFLDNGIRNFALRHFNPLNNNSDQGLLVENLVFNELLKNLSLTDELFFWRTKAGAEVDFVLRHEGEIIPIEVKAGSAVPGKLTRSFHAFLNHFSPAKAIFLNKDLFHIHEFNSTSVYYIPLHWFLFKGLELFFDGDR